jgi:hypothetical protein
LGLSQVIGQDLSSDAVLKQPGFIRARPFFCSARWEGYIVGHFARSFAAFVE